MASAIDELARKLYVDLPICGKVPNPFQLRRARRRRDPHRGPVGGAVERSPGPARVPHRRPAAVAAEGARGDRRAGGDSASNHAPRAGGDTRARILAVALVTVACCLSGTTVPWRALADEEEECPPNVECIYVYAGGSCPDGATCLGRGSINHRPNQIEVEDGYLDSLGEEVDGYFANVSPNPPRDIDADGVLDCWQGLTGNWSAPITSAFQEPRDKGPHKVSISEHRPVPPCMPLRTVL